MDEKDFIVISVDEEITNVNIPWISSYLGTNDDLDKFRDYLRKKTGSKTLDWYNFAGRDIWKMDSDEMKDLNLMLRLTRAFKTDKVDYLIVNPHLKKT